MKVISAESQRLSSALTGVSKYVIAERGIKGFASLDSSFFTLLETTQPIVYRLTSSQLIDERIDLLDK